ncbi:isoprenoid synthase domain-containing protein [Podospora aff. communis PSN243]|uniref:Terpene synthase n=1 Tax=Podospora aff. communis PSN243 TaxID=3040156 RepID=A0AAV9GBG7_9PEZI|nr:isoprenoid synthase domain-containing protein [Podospora aff. communis PSN243]
MAQIVSTSYDSSVSGLKGQTFHIPGLTPLFLSWKQGVNPYYERVRQFMDEQLAGLIKDEAVLRKMRMGDLALFTCCLLPEADYETLEIAALYTIWAFLWDDVVDGSEAEGKGSESEVRKAEQYRDASYPFVKFHLIGASKEEVEPPAPNPACGLFAEVASRLRLACRDEAQIVAFCASIKAYMEACVVEARCRVSGVLPSEEQFYEFRLQTSAVGMLLDLSGMLNRVRLPAEVMAMSEVRHLRTHANKIGIIINELFSFKKELKDAVPLNLIPIVMQYHNLDLASAASHIIGLLRAHARDFDHGASAFRSGVALQHGNDTAEQADRLIGVYQSLVTCVLTFSIQSPRYGVLRDRQKDGSFRITL